MSNITRYDDLWNTAKDDFEDLFNIDPNQVDFFDGDEAITFFIDNIVEHREDHIFHKLIEDKLREHEIKDI